MEKLFTCVNCGRKVDIVYFCPGCGSDVCHACIHGDGHEMDMALRTYRCKKCKEANRDEEK